MNWAELQQDCLVNIFAKLETTNLAESVQFVCNSWFGATLDPLCWKTLTFTNETSFDFVQFAVHRSQRIATTVVIRGSFPEQGLTHLSDQCPELTSLTLSYKVLIKSGLLVSKIIGKWRKLTILRKSACYVYPSGGGRIYGSKNFKGMLHSISVNCVNFVVLHWPHTNFKDEHVSAIVRFLLYIKGLVMSRCMLERDHVVILLENCRNLVHFDVSNCHGFVMDDEILRLSAHIKFFIARGYKLETPLSDITRNRRDLDLTTLVL